MRQFNLEEYLGDPTRPIVTRDGRSVRIICTDRKSNNLPIVGLVKGGQQENIRGYTKDGEYSPGIESLCDLFFASEKHEGWINLYKDDDIVYASMDTFKTKKEAESASCSTCIATVKIEWEE